MRHRDATDDEQATRRLLHEFDTAADSYDRLVGSNPGYHRHLELSASRMRLPGQGRGLRLLDAGCGTGASTAALLRVAPHATIVAADGSAEMLARARAKPWPDSVEFVHARFDQLDARQVGGEFDGILAAYLIRNLPDADAGLARLRELLRPGAPLAVHEYSLTTDAATRLLWTAVCWSVIIPSGQLITRRSQLYRYLWRSVLAFDSPTRLRQRMTAAGFDDVHIEPMTGWQRRIVHTAVGIRPLAQPGTAAQSATAAQSETADR